ncbi:DUF2948 family protein [uncultured Sneathiella sp.]|jgi:hypothetical protein|uniref:DUF2948 family protein n=1 Tax=uncultured Sneathiella sp. TaxID=879315 RepID=UPI002597639A|nr:DUF2948 family protein [uncultured Sneathiella sp.]
MPKSLKLIAAEIEDMEILSAALEGMITSPGEMSYLKSARAFTVMGSRFKWEDVTDDPEKDNSWLRIRSGLYFGDVMRVKAVGVSQNNPTEVLELLSLSTHLGEAGQAEICLNFAGGGTLCLTMECINVTLTDTGEPWTTERKPGHDDAPFTEQET